MATYNSNLVIKKGRLRGRYSGKPDTFNGRILVKNATVLAINDILLFIPVGENQLITDVDTLVVGNCGTAAGSYGYFQILDSAGVAVVVQRNGPRGPSSTLYPSPVSSPTAYHAAAALAGYNKYAVAAPTKLTGPVYIGVQITTAGTMTGDVEFFGGASLLGEVSTSILTGNAAPSGNVNDYLLTAR